MKTPKKPANKPSKITIEKPDLLQWVNKYKFKTKHPTNVLELLKKWR